MSQKLSQSLGLKVIQAIALVGGLTSSIFPQVEALLLSDIEYQKALESIARRKKMDSYRSVIDFLFVEIHPGSKWRHKCNKFYDGTGSPLRDLISVEEWKECNTRMLKALEVAYEIHCAKQRLCSWTDFKFQVKKALSTAA